MKNNKYFFWGTLIMVMAFTLVLAGCATTVETPATPDPQAEQLAAEINAIKDGSAVVEGAKVTLSGEVQLASLTVPAGITLDVTAESAVLCLRDQAILTVNGTIISKPVGVRMEDSAIAATINGSGAIRLNSGGNLLSAGVNKKLTLDGVTLVGLENNTRPLVYVPGTLVLKSGAITGNTAEKGGGVYVQKNGAFIMEGGTISGNKANLGGGVFSNENGTFTMKNGEISNNKATEDGGGVFFNDDGTFTMEGGMVYGKNATEKLKNTAANGAAVANSNGNGNGNREDTITSYP